MIINNRNEQIMKIVTCTNTQQLEMIDNINFNNENNNNKK